jgi:acyl carrier protein
MASVYERVDSAGLSGGGLPLETVSDDSVRSRLVGVVGALMQRRQLELPTSLDQSLRDAGLKSLDLVNMMLAVEDEFGIEIPQNLLSIDNFRTIRAIEELVAQVVPE